MLFGNIDATVTKDINAMAAQHPSVPKRVVDSKGTGMFELDGRTHKMKTPTVKDDFEYMRNMMEKGKVIEHRSKASPMDLSAVSEIHDHTDYVKWCDEGSPADSWDNNGEWTEDCSQYHEEDGEEGDRQQLAAITAAAAHVDAPKGKGKGKSKSKKGKGKGKGKAGKGNSDNTTSKAVVAQTPTPGETRQCYNCNGWGHIGKDRKMKDRQDLKPLGRGE
jgi:hypothetical protein